ncbi:hypothetical protein [Foetidibacter luteolus]|uniref:hypothetical protein n=1 Tax=Foetidibacter luteolus TaxID=2608880 RepID=UPI00129B8F95|nr:hypothetical protein [Foetidibacter luteolus]
MKQILIASLCIAAITGCGDGKFQDERAREDSAAMNATPDSALNETNNQNAHAGIGTDSAAADSGMVNKEDSSLKNK